MNADVSPKRAPRPALPRRSEHPARDRPAGEARRDGRRARGRTRPRRADDVPRRSRRHVHAVEVDRVARADAPRRARRALERRASSFGDAHEARRLGDFGPRPTKLVSNLPYNVAAAVVVDSLETHAVDRAVVRDGAEGGRRAVLRRAGDEGVRRGLGARSARGRSGRALTLSRERCSGHARGWTRCSSRSTRSPRPPALRPGQGGRPGRVRAPAEDASQLARALGACRPGATPRLRSPRSATRPRLAPRSSHPEEFARLAELLRDDDDRRAGEDQPRARRRAAQRGRQARDRRRCTSGSRSRTR